MPDGAGDLRKSLEALTDADATKVLGALNAALYKQAEAAAPDDAARATLIEATRPAAADGLVRDLASHDVPPPAPRDLLLALADLPGLEPELRKALQHRQFAFGVVEIAIFAGITLVLTTQFDARIERDAKGRLTWHFGAKKKPTALSFLGRLFGLAPGTAAADDPPPAKPKPVGTPVPPKPKAKARP